MNKQLTFSRQIKDELSSLACARPCCQRAELAAAFFGAGRFSGRNATLTTAHVGTAQRLASLVRKCYNGSIAWQAGRELISLTLDQPDMFRALCSDLKKLFGFDLESGAGSAPPSLPDCCRQAVLRSLFLACGSISAPSAAYHLELSLHRPEAAVMAIRLLDGLSISSGLVRRHSYDVVYLKEGQYIADFLLHTGAHLSLLTFESLRVEKEMRNSVNRVVNCDSANTQRVANTAARQLDLIRNLSDQVGIGALPADLQAAAEVRLANPDLSLKELGEQMQPPLGKSGMNHRLKRLEQIAADILAKKGNDMHGT